MYHLTMKIDIYNDYQVLLLRGQRRYLKAAQAPILKFQNSENTSDMHYSGRQFQ